MLSALLLDQNWEQWVQLSCLTQAQLSLVMNFRVTGATPLLSIAHSFAKGASQLLACLQTLL